MRKQVALVLRVSVSVLLKETIFLGIGCIRLVNYKKTSNFKECSRSLTDRGDR